MREKLLKHLAALKKVGMFFTICFLGTGTYAQHIAESFESHSFPPQNWNIEGFYANWAPFLGNASHGIKSLQVGNLGGNPANSAFYTPLLALQAGQTVEITFDYTVTEIGESGAKLTIYASEGNVTPSYPYTTLHNFEFTELVPYTTQSIIFTATETRNYSFSFWVESPIHQKFNLSIDKLIIQDKYDCTPPTGLTVSAVTANSATIDWEAGGDETDWQIQTTQGGLPVADKWVSLAVSQSNLIGLISGTTYSAYVRSECAPGEYSSFPLAIDFTTLCADTILAPYSIPFTTYDIPGCWLENGDTNWDFNLYVDHDAMNAGDHSLFQGTTQYAWIDGTNNTNGETATLTSPKINISELANPALEFYVYSENSNNGIYNTFIAEVFNGTSWQEVASLNASSGGWKFYSIDLGPFEQNIVQARFTVTGNGETTYYNDILIDDVAFKEKTTCFPLTSFNTDLITDKSIKISWTSENTNGTWDIAYGVYNDIFNGTPDITGSTNTVIIDDLEPVTKYYIYIRSNCGDGHVGEWTGPYMVVTDCEVYVPNYEEKFDSSIEYNLTYWSYPLPTCWQEALGGDAATGPLYYGTGDWRPNPDAEYGLGTNSASVSIALGGSGISSWLISPYFDFSNAEYEAKIRIIVTSDTYSTTNTSMGSDDEIHFMYSENGIDWHSLKVWSGADAEDLYLGYHTSIISLEGITGENVRFAFWTNEGEPDNIIYNFQVDNLEIREKSICLETLNLSAKGITDVSAKLGWDNPGSAASWKIAIVPTGVTPTNEWQTVFTNPYPAAGLTANTTYDFYVKSICGGIESEVVTGPFKFQTRCAPIVAPYTETFVEYFEQPECWITNPAIVNVILFSVISWNFTTEAKFDAAVAGDHTVGGETQYAWLNTTNFTNKQWGYLTTPLVDVSPLSNPALQFYLFSKNTVDNAVNYVIVEIYDGDQWVEATRIENYTNSWAPYTIDLVSLGVTGVTEARFKVIINSNGGSAGYNNILIDDVSFIEMPECIAPFNINVTEISDTSAKVVWETTGTSTSWEVEYGPIGFTPGEGTVVTVNITPEVILTEMDDNQEYDVYVKSLCGGETVGPQTFITDTTSGINDPELAKIFVYPNPTADVLNMESSTVIDTVEVYSIVGQLVKKQSFNVNSVSIVMSDLSEGIYMVKAFSGKKVGTYKVIKKQ